MRLKGAGERRMNMSELANISFNLDYDLAWLAERVCEAKNTTLEKELVKTIRSLAEETRKEEIQRKVVSADRRALGVMRQLEIPIIEEKKSIVQPVRSHAQVQTPPVPPRPQAQVQTPPAKAHAQVQTPPRPQTPPQPPKPAQPAQPAQKMQHTAPAVPQGQRTAQAYTQERDMSPLSLLTELLTSSSGDPMDLLMGALNLGQNTQERDVVELPQLYGNAVPAEVFMELLCRVPQGQVTTLEDLESCLKQLYGVSRVRLSAGLSREMKDGRRVPYWRIVEDGGILSGNGMVSLEAQVKLLDREGAPIVTDGRRYAVRDYQRRRFDFSTLRFRR